MHDESACPGGVDGYAGAGRAIVDAVSEASVPTDLLDAVVVAVTPTTQV